MANEFIDIGQFTTEFGRPLSDAETPQATRLLTVLSDAIRERKPDVDGLAAAQVVFELVRDALLYGEFAPLSSFQSITSRRTEAGTFATEGRPIDDFLTGRQKEMLGITASTKATARGTFKNCDY